MCSPPQRPVHPLLAHGPYGVGFRSSWEFDDTRTYRTEFDGGKTYGAQESPRPVLVLQWYPSRDHHGDNMTHDQYFDITDGGPRLHDLADALTVYARSMFAFYVMDKPEDELCDSERAEMAEVLSQPTHCVRGAEAADGPFPLVVYHGGLGSSFEDNAALCAYLASHGYVVLGSAFPDADGESFDIDGFVGSAGDVEFLVDWAQTTSAADVSRVGLIGHSAGAQAMLMSVARFETRCSALVLLDTTQDYFSLSIPFFAPLVREVTAGIASVTVPMLVVARPPAVFALCDELVNADRVYLTVPGLEHNDFISQGQQRLARTTQATPAEHRYYRVVCERTLQFFDATLHDDRTVAAALTQTVPWDPGGPCVVRVPRGSTSPEPYDAASHTPPTPRQFARLLATPGIQQACQVLERCRSTAPRHPVCTDTTLAGSLLYELIDAGRDDDARRFSEMLTSMSLDVLGWFLEQAEDLGGELALQFLNVAHWLEPENAAITAKLAR